jgi:1,4-dihydroxy-2-naphthoyl-CoA hydrolase
MSIWFKTPKLDLINQFGDDTMVSHLEIVFTEIGEDYLKATMPVDKRTHQPFGLLHGGASVALAETLASTGANLCVDTEGQYCVGLEINANHIRSVREGKVIGTCRPVHLGKTTQVWEVHVTDEGGHRTCISRVTMAVLSR